MITVSGAMSVQMCNVDLRAETLVVMPYSRTTDGFWVLDGDPMLLPATATAAELGAAIRDALGRSRQGLPSPAPGAELSEALLEMFNVADYADYARGTRSVGVRATDTDHGETVRITPKKNGGGKTGFTAIRHAQRTLTADSAVELGDAVRAALDVATG